MHEGIDIGDDIQTGPYVYITDQNHSYADPDQPVGTQWPVEAPVRIGSGSWLRANAVVLPGADIGRHAVVRNAILDKNVMVPEGAEIGVDLERDRKRFTVSDGGIVVIGKGQRIEV